MDLGGLTPPFHLDLLVSFLLVPLSRLSSGRPKMTGLFRRSVSGSVSTKSKIPALLEIGHSKKDKPKKEK